MTTNLTPNEALNLITNGDALLIDVREPEEFKSEHIAYAISIPLSTLREDFESLKIPQNKTLIFQCLKGTRGQMACEQIKGLGDTQNEIANIIGGITEWKEQNLPVISTGTAPQKLSIMRQVQIIVGFLIALFSILGFTGITAGFAIAGFFGAALLFAGLTGWCGLAMLLSHMPWNK